MTWSLAKSRSTSTSMWMELLVTLSQSSTHTHTHTHTLSMADLILSELRVQETFHQLSISPSFFKMLLSVPVHSRSTAFAVDVRSESVVVSEQATLGCLEVEIKADMQKWGYYVYLFLQFINDLEKEMMYGSWPRSLKTVSPSLFSWHHLLLSDEISLSLVACWPTVPPAHLPRHAKADC